MTALPYLTAWIVSFPISYVSDLCIRKNIVTTQMSRKICNTIGQWTPAIALIGLGYTRQDQPELAISILVIAVSSNIAAFCGHNVNHMDLSPNFAGTLMGLTNAIASICSILAPLIAGVIVEDPVRKISHSYFYFYNYKFKKFKKIYKFKKDRTITLRDLNVNLSSFSLEFIIAYSKDL